MGEAAARLRLETGPIKKVGGRGRTNYIPVEKTWGRERGLFVLKKQGLRENVNVGVCECVSACVPCVRACANLSCGMESV